MASSWAGVARLPRPRPHALHQTPSPAAPCPGVPVRDRGPRLRTARRGGPVLVEGPWFAERGARIREVLGTLGYAGYEPAEERWSGSGSTIPTPPTSRPSSSPPATSRRPSPPAGRDHRASLVPRGVPQHVIEGTQDSAPYPARVAADPEPGGDLLVIHEGSAVRLARGSTIRWRSVPGAHHDLLVDGDEAWVLDRTVTRRPHGSGAGSAARRSRSPETVSSASRSTTVGCWSARSWSCSTTPAGTRSIGRRSSVRDRGDRGRPARRRATDALDPLHANGLARLDPSRSVYRVPPGSGGLHELRGTCRIDAPAGALRGRPRPPARPRRWRGPCCSTTSAPPLPLPRLSDLSISPSDRTAQVLFHGTEEDPFFSRLRRRPSAAGGPAAGGREHRGPPCRSSIQAPPLGIPHPVPDPRGGPGRRPSRHETGAVLRGHRQQFAKPGRYWSRGVKACPPAPTLPQCGSTSSESSGPNPPRISKHPTARSTTKTTGPVRSHKRSRSSPRSTAEHRSLSSSST